MTRAAIVRLEPQGYQVCHGNHGIIDADTLVECVRIHQRAARQSLPTEGSKTVCDSCRTQLCPFRLLRFNSAIVQASATGLSPKSVPRSSQLIAKPSVIARSCYAHPTPKSAPVLHRVSSSSFPAPYGGPQVAPQPQLAMRVVANGWMVFIAYSRILRFGRVPMVFAVVVLRLLVLSTCSGVRLGVEVCLRVGPCLEQVLSGFRTSVKCLL
jgi:hypothetical protein